jgi:hypothetical protein
MRRLINSFAVATAALADFTDPVDLLVLDALRLFEPNVYLYVRRSIGDLTDDDVPKAEYNDPGTITEILKDVSEPYAARHALALLFPKAELLLKTAVYSGPRDSSLRQRARRISIADFAPAYFGLDPQKATWARSELDRILKGDPELAFRTVEERLASAAEEDRSRLRRLFLDELRTTFEVTRGITQDWLVALLNASTMYVAARDEIDQFLYIEENEDRLRMIVIRALEKLGPEEGPAVVATAIARSNDLSVLCAAFRSVAGDKRPKGAAARSSSAALLGDKSEVVREQLLARVRQLAATGAIWAQAVPRDIVLFWWGSTLDEEVRDFTSSAARTPAGSLSLLSIPVHAVYSTAGNYETVSPTWSEILDLPALEACAQEILATEVAAKDKQIAQRFQTAMENTERD